MKIFSKMCIIMLSCVLAAGMLIAPQSVEANHLNQYYPEDYLDGDLNFPCIWVHMNGAWFLDKSSLVAERYDPPYYILSIEGVYVYYEGRDAVEVKRKRIGPLRYFYNYDTKEMYVDRKTGNSDWRYIKPHGPNSESGVVMHIGEAAFYVNYNMKFYGAQKMPNPNWKGSPYADVFRDDFYKYL